VLLLLPMLGLAVLLHRLGRMLVRLGRALAARWLPARAPLRARGDRPERWARPRPRPAPRHRTPPPPRQRPLPRHRVWPAPALPVEWPCRNCAPAPAAPRPAGEGSG
ncbi:hypothetical protein RF647_19120, partial [Kocuria sp. CPCC 205263]